MNPHSMWFECASRKAHTSSPVFSDLMGTPHMWSVSRSASANMCLCPCVYVTGNQPVWSVPIIPCRSSQGKEHANTFLCFPFARDGFLRGLSTLGSVAHSIDNTLGSAADSLLDQMLMSEDCFLTLGWELFHP